MLPRPRRTDVKPPSIPTTLRWPAVWGWLGVLLLLLDAVYRLAPIAWEALRSSSLGLRHWVFLVTWTAFAAVAEGYQAFRKRFAPRVARRMGELMSTDPPALHRALAPLYCMSLIGDAPRRMWIQRALVAFIVALVVLVKRAPQPWRGLVDAGVVVALAWGAAEVFRQGMGVLRGETSSARR